jgi:hypothetical protein
MSSVGAAAVLVGCSSGGEAPSDFCKSVDALDATVTQINQSSLTKATIEAVEASLAAADTAVKNLSDTVESEFAQVADAVEAAMTELDQTVTAAVDQPTPGNLDAARQSMSELTTAVDDLSDSTSDGC